MIARHSAEWMLPKTVSIAYTVQYGAESVIYTVFQFRENVNILKKAV